MSDETPKPPQLPPKYYLDYFEYLLEFVRKMYSPLLNPGEVRFLEEYYALSEDARCLFIRMSNRRGAFFRPESLNYAEIDDMPAALAELTDAAFAEETGVGHAAAAEVILHTLTRPELFEITKLLKPELMPHKTIKKDDLVRWLLYSYEPDLLAETATRVVRLIRVLRETEVTMMKFLFFGNRYDDMTEFVIRDLGHVRFQTFDEEALAVRFHSRKEIDDTLSVALMKETFRELKTTLPPEDIFDWVMNWHGGIGAEMSAVAQPSLQKLLLSVGAWLERHKLPEQALALFQLTRLPPSRERRVRLLSRLGLTEEATALCNEMIVSPQNADELYFGNDFLEKLQKSAKRYVKQTTLALNEARVIPVPVTFRYRVEAGAAGYYVAEGYQAVFSENLPWRAIFGLLFWDIIYDTNVKTIHHPLQRVPSDFFLPDFYQKRAGALTQRLDELNTSEKIVAAMQRTYAARFGVANVLVTWSDDIFSTAVTIATLLTASQLRAILLEIASDLRAKTRGFPDLLVWTGETYSFVEIKSPTDHLSAQQLYWQHFLRRIDVNTEVVKVEWEYPGPPLP